MSSFRKFYRPPAAACSAAAGAGLSGVWLEGEAAVHGAYKKMVDSNYIDQEGRGHLHLALLHVPEDPDLVSHVIRVGKCDVNAADKDGVRPVAYAARMGAIKCLKILIQQGCELDHVDHSGLSALMDAAGAGHHEVVEMLLRAGAAVSVTSRQGESALHYAVGAACTTSVRSLLKYASKVNHQDNLGRSALHLAARAGSADMLTTLLTYHYHSKVQLNLRDESGRTAVHWAVDSASDQCLAILLEYLADPSLFDASCNSPLLLAIKANRPTMVQQLLDAGARITLQDGRSPLSIASLLGHSQCVDALLGAGLDSNSCGHFGQTPLICATFECHQEIINSLITSGASPSGLSQTGATPLLAALSCITKQNVAARHAIVIKLIRAGADVNFAFARSWYNNPITKASNSPLSLTMESGYVSLVQILLLSGVKVSSLNLTSWCAGDQSMDVYNRKDILAPIQEHFSSPLPLALQIRQVIRKAIGPMNVEKKIQSLMIAPGLVNFLLYDDLAHIAVEQAGPGPRYRDRGGASYHPFREGERIGILDLQDGMQQILMGSHLAATLYGS